MSIMLRNSMRTPDGTHLISRHRHDYVSHTDKNGEVYMVDGGNDYIRRSVNNIPAKDTTLFLEDGHEVLREELVWGTYGKDGTGELQRIKIKSLSLAHIKAIVDEEHGSEAYRRVMRDEIEWRSIHEKGSEAKRLEIQREASYG